jgi:protein CpxP
MKNLLMLATAFTLLGTAPTLAQTTAAAGRAGRADLSPQQRADQASSRLSQSLSLSAEQAAKVNAILRQRAQAVDALKAKVQSAGRSQEAGQELRAISQQADEQLKGVLSAGQYASYEKNREDKMADLRERRQQHQGAR